MDEMYIADAEGYSGIAPTGDSRDRSGISDEEANRRASAFQAKWCNKSTEEFLATMPETVPVDESDRTSDADKMSNMWVKYVNWKKFWFPNESPFMEDFARYMRNFHQYDIRNGS